MAQCIHPSTPTHARRGRSILAAIMAVAIVLTGLTVTSEPAEASTAARVEYRRNSWGPAVTHQVSFNREATRLAAFSYSAAARLVERQVPGSVGRLVTAALKLRAWEFRNHYNAGNCARFDLHFWGTTPTVSWVHVIPRGQGICR